MNRRMSFLAGVSALSLLGAGSLVIAEQEHKPNMHMHKTEMTHRPDQEVAGAVAPRYGRAVSQEDPAQERRQLRERRQALRQARSVL
jgi:hypothetical protein